MPVYHCPICDKTICVQRREDAPYRPFCCPRCQMLDLGKWFAGEYRISEPLETIETIEDEPIQDEVN
ncbi:MAG: DNA gyrase inhibitor YacG [Planctomycetota bacterium]